MWLTGFLPGFFSFFHISLLFQLFNFYKFVFHQEVDFKDPSDDDNFGLETPAFHPGLCDPLWSLDPGQKSLHPSKIDQNEYWIKDDNSGI